MSKLEKLPAELKLSILQNLSKQDLCNVALVSKNLKESALDKTLWKEFSITINGYLTQKQREEGSDVLLTSSRFQNLNSVKILNLENLMATEVRTEVFKLIEKVEKVDLSQAQLNSRETKAILIKVSSTNSVEELIMSDEVAQALVSLSYHDLLKVLPKVKNVTPDIHMFVD